MADDDCSHKIKKCLLLGRKAIANLESILKSRDITLPTKNVLLRLPEFAQTRVCWVKDASQPSHPLSSPSPPALNLSQDQGLFQWVGSLNRGPKNWSFSFIISPSNEYSGLISFRMDWLDLLAVQRTLKSLLQSIGTSASVLPVNIQDWFPLGLTGLISLQCKGLSRIFSSTIIRKHEFLMLSLFYGPALTSVHDYWKSHSFDCSFVGKMMSLLFNTASRSS